MISAVPVLYRLASCGIDVNMRNQAGNTCLHLSCVKPLCEPLWEHLIRIGKLMNVRSAHNHLTIDNRHQPSNNRACNEAAWPCRLEFIY